jgi:hypothetical protein
MTWIFSAELLSSLPSFSPFVAIAASISAAVTMPL